MFMGREWDEGQLGVLTPFKLLPFFPVRVCLGIVLINRDLVEVVARVRVVRQHIGWGCFRADNSKGWTRTGRRMDFQRVGVLPGRINACVSFLGKQSHGQLTWRCGSSEDHCWERRGQSSLFLRLPFCLYSSLPRPPPFITDDYALKWHGFHIFSLAEAFEIQGASLNPSPRRYSCRTVQVLS